MAHVNQVQPVMKDPAKCQVKRSELICLPFPSLGDVGASTCIDGLLWRALLKFAKTMFFVF